MTQADIKTLVDYKRKALTPDDVMQLIANIGKQLAELPQHSELTNIDRIGITAKEIYLLGFAEGLDLYNTAYAME